MCHVSTPRYPDTEAGKYTGYPGKSCQTVRIIIALVSEYATTYAQSFMCITLTTSTINNIAHMVSFLSAVVLLSLAACYYVLSYTFSSSSNGIVPLSTLPVWPLRWIKRRILTSSLLVWLQLEKIIHSNTSTTFIVLWLGTGIKTPTSTNIMFSSKVCLFKPSYSLTKHMFFSKVARFTSRSLVSFSI